MTPDHAAPEQPEEEHAVIEPGLADSEDVATQAATGPVAVGPGDPAGQPAVHAQRQVDGEPSTGTRGNGEAATDAAPAGWSGTTTAVDASLLDLVDRLTAV